MPRLNFNLLEMTEDFPGLCKLLAHLVDELTVLGLPQVNMIRKL